MDLMWSLTNFETEAYTGKPIRYKAELVAHQYKFNGEIQPANVVQELINKINKPTPKGPDLLPRVEKVIFSGRKTIVLWADKTKTVVTCSIEDAYDKQMGFAMACLKKIMGNNSTFKKFINKVVPPAKTCTNCKHGYKDMDEPPCNKCDKNNSKWEAAK